MPRYRLFLGQLLLIAGSSGAQWVLPDAFFFAVCHSPGPQNWGLKSPDCTLLMHVPWELHLLLHKPFWEVCGDQAVTQGSHQLYYWTFRASENCKPLMPAGVLSLSCLCPPWFSGRWGGRGLGQSCLLTRGHPHLPV